MLRERMDDVFVSDVVKNEKSIRGVFEWYQ